MALLSAIVMLFSMNAFKYDAKALENRPLCNMAEHLHGETCLDENKQLVCGKEEHTHTSACFHAPSTEPTLNDFVKLNSRVVLASPLNTVGDDVVSENIEDPVKEVIIDLPGSAEDSEEGNGLTIDYDHRAEETQILIYTINGSEVLLSKVLKAVDKAVTGIVLIGEIQDHVFVEEHIALVPVEGIADEYVINVKKDFDIVELYVETSTESFSVYLANGVAAENGPTGETAVENAKETDGGDAASEEGTGEEVPVDEEETKEETVEETVEASEEETEETPEEETKEEAQEETEGTPEEETEGTPEEETEGTPEEEVEETPEEETEEETVEETKEEAEEETKEETEETPEEEAKEEAQEETEEASEEETEETPEEETEAVEEAQPASGILGDGNVTIVPVDEAARLGSSVTYKENQNKDADIEELKALLGMNAPRRMMMAAAAASETGSAEGYAVFDITMLDEADQPISESGAVQVTVYPENVNLFDEVPEDARVTGINYTLYHVHNGAVQTLDVQVNQENGRVQSVTFETDSFSNFILKYTVDFHYNGADVSIEGGSQVLLSTLIEQLGIVDENGDPIDVVKVASVSFTDERLVTVEEVSGEVEVNGEAVDVGEKDFLLTSNESFTSAEQLILTLIGDESDPIVVEVTDPAESTNLEAFLVNATIVGATQTGAGYEVQQGQEYTIKLNFKETAALQFDNTATLVYDLPDGLVIPEAADTTINVSIISNGKTYEVPADVHVGTDGRMTVTFRQDDENFHRLASSTNVSLHTEIIALFDGTETSIHFSDSVIKEVVFPDEPAPNVGIIKSATYDAATGKFYYTIRVTCTGADATNVHVTDVISGNALTNMSPVTIIGNSSTPTGGSNGSGFEYTFPTMREGEEILLTYTADVNFDMDTDHNAIITADQTKNTAKVESPDTPPHTSEYSHQIKFSTIRKGDGTIVGKTGDVSTLSWEVEVNPEALVALNGSTFTDSINGNGFPMHYSGTGLTVKVYDQSGALIRTDYKNWSELGVNSSSTSYTYTFTDTTPYKYVFQYTTDVDTSTAMDDVTVDNNASYPYGSTGSHGYIPTDENNKLSLKKSVESYNSREVNWKVVIHVPPQGLSGADAKLQDTLPARYIWNIGRTCRDELVSDSVVVVSGLVSGETWQLDSQPGSFSIQFYADGAAGLKSTPAGRDIVVTYKTLVDQDWLAAAADAQDLQSHTNTAIINEIRSPATVILGSADISKTCDGIQKTITVNGVDRKIYQYNILLENVMDDSIEVVDTFDTSILELLPSSIEVDNSNDRNRYIYGGTQYYQGILYGSAPINVTSTATGAIFSTSSLPKDSNGVHYSYYRICYYLMLKEGVDLEQLAANNGGSYKVKNKATWGTHDDEGDFEVKYEPLKKELIEEASATDRYATFRITYNERKASLADGLDLPMYDKLSATLSLDYSSFEFETDPAGVNISYTISGVRDDNGVATGETMINFTIPDSTKVVITYRALVVGSGTVSIRNDVDIGTEHDEVDTNQHVSVDGGGEGSICRMTVSKVDGYDASKKLAGVKFRLTCDDPTGLPEGGLILETDANGLLIIDGDELRENYEALLFTGVEYHLTEIEEPDGYTKIGFDYLFTFVEDPAQVNYNDYHYFIVDSMQIKNWPYEGLIIEKQVDSPNQDDYDKSFTFTITLSNEAVEGADYEGNNLVRGDQVTGKYGDVNFTNGVATVTLKHGQQVSIYGLPVPTGTKYTVEEITTEGCRVSVNDGTTTTQGKVYHGQVDHNNYTLLEYTNTFEEDKGSLKITKNVTVNGSEDGVGTLADGTYTFVIKQEGSPVSAGNVEGEPISNGQVTITITNGAATTVEVTDLPAGEYTIEEAAPTNDTVLALINGEDAGGGRSATVTVEAGKSGDEVPATAIVTFTNDKTITGSLEVNKRLQLNGQDSEATDDKTFTFGLYRQIDGEWVPVAREVDGAQVNWTETVTVAEGSATGTATFAPIDVGETYRVYELNESEAIEHGGWFDEYTVTYADNDGVEVTLTETSATTTVTNNRETVEKKVRKTWGPDQVPPEGAEVTILLSGTVYDDIEEQRQPVDLWAIGFIPEIRLNGGRMDGGSDTNEAPWRYVWEDLPKYDDEGRQIEYTTEETAYTINGEAVDITTVGLQPSATEDTDYPGFTLITNRVPTVDIEVNKEWEIGADTRWPADVEEVVVQLQQSVDGGAAQDVDGKTAAINPENWQLTQAGIDALTDEAERAAAQTELDKRFIRDLPKYDSAGKLITYSVKETTPASGFTVTYSPVGTAVGGLITVKNQRDVPDLDLTVKKAWRFKPANGDERDMTEEEMAGLSVDYTVWRKAYTDPELTEPYNTTGEPEPVTDLTLDGNGFTGTLNSENGWEEHVEKLPAQGEVGTEAPKTVVYYKYYVKETAGENYPAIEAEDAETAGADAGKFVFVNKLTEAKIEKQWARNGESASTQWPQFNGSYPSVTFRLTRSVAYGDAEPVEDESFEATVIVGTDDGTTFTLKDGGGSAVPANTASFDDGVLTFHNLAVSGADEAASVIGSYSYSIAETAVTLGENDITEVFTQDTSADGTIINRYMDFDVKKVWKNHREEAIAWPDGLSITLKMVRGTAVSDGALAGEDEDFGLDIVLTRNGNTIVGTASNTAGRTLPANAADIAVTVTSDGSHVNNIHVEPLAAGYVYQVTEDSLTDYTTSYYDSSDAAKAESENALDGEKIVNTSVSYSMPSTGGPGTTIFCVLGAALSLLAAVLLFVRKRSDADRIN